MARGMTNVLVVACENASQAMTIYYSAKKRPEMARVMVCANKPKNRDGVLYSHKVFADMSGPWLEG